MRVLLQPFEKIAFLAHFCHKYSLNFLAGQLFKSITFIFLGDKSPVVLIRVVICGTFYQRELCSSYPVSHLEFEGNLPNDSIYDSFSDSFSPPCIVLLLPDLLPAMQSMHADGGGMVVTFISCRS